MPAHAVSGLPPHTKQRQQSRPAIATHRQDKDNRDPIISSIISSFDESTTLALSPRSSKLNTQDQETDASYHAIVARASRRVGRQKLRRSISLPSGMGPDTLNEAGRPQQPSVDPPGHGHGDAAEFPVVPTTRPAPKTSWSHGPLTPSSLKTRLRPASTASRDSRESTSTLSLNVALDTFRSKADRSSSSLTPSTRSPSYRTSLSLKSTRDDDVSLCDTPGTAKTPSTANLSAAPGPARHSTSPLLEQPLGRQSPRHDREPLDTLAPGKLRPEIAAATTSLRSRRPNLAVKSPLRELHLQDTMEELDSKALRDGTVRHAATTIFTPLSAKHRSAVIIGATIPPRKSSIDQTSSPPHQRRRSGKSRDAERKKRQDATASRSWTGRRASKLEASRAANAFAGLDEDDATVKRIKELKQIRQDRLTKESAAAEHSNNGDRVLSTDAKPIVPSPANRNPILPETVTRMPRGEAEERKEQKAGVSNRPFAHGVQLSTAPSGSSAELIINAQSNHTARSTTSASSRFTSDSAGSELVLRQTLRAPHARSGDALTASQRHIELLKSPTPIKSRLLHGSGPEASNLIRSSTSHPLLSPLIKSDSDDYDSRPFPDISLLNESRERGRRNSMNDVYYSQVLDEEEIQERRKNVAASVDAYLKAPRLSQRIRRPDGRLITFSEVGDPAGAAVIVCVGMGLTRYITAFYDELAATLGLRLITLDRPGVGGSEPYPERERIGPLSWPDDVLAVTQHLRISQFSLLAHSAGAIYALATALTLPQCVRGKVHLLAPWIPPSQFDTFGIKDVSPDAMPVGALPRSQRLLRVLPIPFFKAANGGLFAPASIKPASVASSPSPGRDGLRSGKPKRRPEPIHRESLILMDQVLPDKPVNNMFSPSKAAGDGMDKFGADRQPSLSLSLTATASPIDPDFMFAAEAMGAAEHSARERQVAYSSLLTEQTWIMATRNANAAVDLIVCLERLRDIGFRYVDIQRQIVIVHGSEDTRVPVENVRWISEQINRRAATVRGAGDDDDRGERGGCEVRVLTGEGHGLMASPAVMMDVLTDISTYWKPTKR